MKKTLIILFILILVLVFTAMSNNTPRVIISNLSKAGEINPGELRYQINLFGVLPVGEAIFALEKQEEYEGRQVYHLSATAKNLDIYSCLFNNYVVLDSYIDTQQFNPVLFKQRMNIKGKGSIEKVISYDQSQGVMSIAGVRRQILPNTQDPLSAMLNIKRMDFNKVKEWEMNINTNQKNYILKGIATQQDIIVNKKTYRIVLAKAQIKRRDKNPYHKSSISMVLLNEKENIPILIKVFASGVLINAKLIDIR